MLHYEQAGIELLVSFEREHFDAIDCIVSSKSERVKSKNWKEVKKDHTGCFIRNNWNILMIDIVINTAIAERKTITGTPTTGVTTRPPNIAYKPKNTPAMVNLS